MLDNVTIEGACALAAVLFTILGIICGGTWWCSAIFSKVAQLVKQLEAINATLQQAQGANDERFKTIESEQRSHVTRIVKIEAKIGL